jgi:glycosyltransferase 2 family protein
MSMTQERMKRKTMKKSAFKWLFNVAVIGLISYWSQTEMARTVFSKLLSIHWGYLAAMMGISLLLMLISSARWARLISAFGNPAPPILELLKLSLIGHFYNTFVPGAIGGDVLRATVTRAYYKKQNTSFLVVFSERALGLLCLCLLLLVGLLNVPSDILPQAKYLGLGGLAITVLVGCTIHFRARLLAFTQPYLDGLERPLELVWAFGISFVGQMSTLTLFAIIVWTFDAELSLSTMLFIFPLGLLASVIPVTVLGAGARELALISMLINYGRLSETVAVSISTTYLGCLWFLGLIGGMLHLFSRRKTTVHKETRVGYDTTQSFD